MRAPMQTIVKAVTKQRAIRAVPSRRPTEFQTPSGHYQKNLAWAAASMSILGFGLLHPLSFPDIVGVWFSCGSHSLTDQLESDSDALYHAEATYSICRSRFMRRLAGDIRFSFKKHGGRTRRISLARRPVGRRSMVIHDPPGVASARPMCRKRRRRRSPNASDDTCQ